MVIYKKRVPVIMVLCAIILFTACGARKRARIEKHRQLHALTIDDFASLGGINKGMSFDAVTTVHGNPTKVDENTGTKIKYANVYYNGRYGERLFHFTYDKRDNIVNHLRLTGEAEINYESTREHFKKAGVKDIKLQLLGMHRDSIISIFGEPTRIKTSDLEYESGGTTVIFSCYPFTGDRCGEIYVFWNYFFKEEEKK